MAEHPRKKRKLDFAISDPNEANAQPKKSKEERREAKRSKKTRDTAPEGRQSKDLEIEAEVDVQDKKAAKAARKAAKAKRKAEKAVTVATEPAAKIDDTLNGQDPNTANGIMEGKSAHIEARDRTQAQKEARTRMIMNGIRNQREAPVAIPATSVNGNAGNKKDLDLQNGTEKVHIEEVQQKEPIVDTHESPSIKNSNVKVVSNGIDHSDSKDAYKTDSELVALPQQTIDNFLRLNHIKIDERSTSNGDSLRPILDFKYLPPIVPASQAKLLLGSFKTPTPIQAAAWPHLLSDRDVVGIAETGSGKTLAFGIPCIRAVERMQSGHSSKIRAVILSPTRELANQIDAQLKPIAKACNLRTVCVYGGENKGPQREALKKAHIIVATPGRLIDFVEEKAVKLKHVKYLVLDEADRMLDQGFKDAVTQIITGCASIKKGRQTSMFTATWPQSVRELASTFMNEPVHITIGLNNPNNELRANRNVKQVVEVMGSLAKEGRLRELIRQYSPSNSHNKDGMSDNRILVFCLYKKECERIEKMLRKLLSGAIKGIACIHGDMTQPMRTMALKDFKAGYIPVLVATDVAARGLDIPDVKLVINFTFPLTAEDYVHRIGRTGRAGKEGLSVTLFTDKDKDRAGELVNVLRAADQEIPEELFKFDLTVKKKEHAVYGRFYREPGAGEATKGTMTKLS